jgi:cell division septum initiation protein DivIVA
VKQLIAYRTMRRAGVVDSRMLLRLALIAIVLGIVALGALQYLNKQQQARLAHQLADQQGPAAKESFALSVAKAQQREALVELSKATNLLEKLSAEVTQFLKMGEALPTNGVGPQNAANQFFASAVQSAPALREIRDKVSQIAPAIFQIESAQGTPYLPDPHVVSDAKKTAEWASTNSANISTLQVRLNQMIRDAKRGVAAAPTVATAPLEQPGTFEAPDTRTNALDRSTSLAEANAEAERTIAESKAEAARIIAETRAEAARILEDARAEAGRIVTEAREKAGANLTAKKDEEPAADASKVSDARKDVSPNPAVAQKRNERSNKVGIQSAAPESHAAEFQEVMKNPRIRTQLLPFTTPGNMRLPGMFRVERSPISLTLLKRFGALEPTPTGLERLVSIAANPQDAIRPRWKFKTKKGVWQRRANEVDQAMSVQRVLIDFGPDFVAEGLLAE